MAEYTEFDRRENETLLAFEAAEQALRDHRPIAQTVVESGKPRKVVLPTEEWLAVDEQLEEELRVAIATWKAAIKANLRNKVHHSTSA